METKKLVKKLNEIQMPKEMQERIIRNCYIEMEEKNMSNNRTKKFFKKPVAIVASLTICVCLAGVTSLAATGKLEGFFKDIVRFDGAVTGTSYEQATEEVELKIVDVTEELTVEVTMINPQVAPYSTFEVFGIENYKIVDMNDNVIMEGTTTEMTEVVNGKVNVNISLENITSGEYKLIVSKLVGSAKADQPLVVSGVWECEFVK